MVKITSIIVVLGLLFGGTGAAVVAAQESLPGETLYTLKTVSEDIQLMLTINEEERLEKALEFVNDRVIEATILEDEGRAWTDQDIAELTVRLETNLKSALLAAIAMDDPEAGLAAIEDQIKISAIAIQKRPQDQVSKGERGDGLMVQKMLRKAYDIVVTGLEDPLNFTNTISSLYGQGLENLDLRVASVDDGIMIVEPNASGWETLDQQNQADQGQSADSSKYNQGHGGPQAIPNPDNAGGTQLSNNKGSGSGNGYNSGNAAVQDPYQSQTQNQTSDNQ